MINLSVNNLSKEDYKNFLNQIFPNNMDYVNELSDYAYSFFLEWVNFLSDKYKFTYQSGITEKNYLIFIYYHSLIETLKKESLKSHESILNELNNACFSKTNMYLNYECKLGKFLDVVNCSRFSINATEIGDLVEISNNVIVNSNLGNLTIEEGVKLQQNAVVIGDLTLKKNSVVGENCVVTDSLEEGEVARIITQVQISKTLNKVSSNKLEIYGIQPKFKNNFTIFGEGFYNPTVLIKLKNQNKELKYEIDYWDKNKIKIKIKNTSPFSQKDVKGLKIIVLSNSEKVVILNNLAVEKCLLNLKN